MWKGYKESKRKVIKESKKKRQRERGRGRKRERGREESLWKRILSGGAQFPGHCIKALCLSLRKYVYSYI